ncbi:MAG: hypothetical protein JOZ69_17435 [Myxococcales bacterium]|nr:hypothetical protein [Myxococcales bacterium]
MGAGDFSFEHDAAFEPGEVGGPLGLGKFEANYEELFADAIEDGVITPEERARLNRAADALGLDRARLRRLEEALEAAYQARHHAPVRELAREVEEEGAPRSIVVGPAGAAEARVAALERRVSELQAQVERLTRELEVARSQVAVEIDVSNMTPGPGEGVAEPVDESPETLLRRLRSDPRDVATLRSLYRVYGAGAAAGTSGGAQDLDRQWLLAQVLVYLGAAGEAERTTYERRRPQGLIKPATSLSADGWRLLFHPDEELLTGQIFGVIVPAMLMGRVSTLRRDKELVRLDPVKKQDPGTSTLQAVRCFAWAARILGLALPSLYADPAEPCVVEMVPALPPAVRLGAGALSGRNPLELAFIAGRHLSWYREEHFIRLLVRSIPDLEDLFLAALSIASAGVPLSQAVKGRVAPLASAIEPMLEPAAVDRLRGHFLRFLDEGGRTNLRRWAEAAERTAARAGLLLANDLHVAHRIFEEEARGGSADSTDSDGMGLSEQMDDLIVFATSDRYANLRKQIRLTS